IERAIVVPHDHDAVAPAVKAEFQGRRKTARVAGIRVVDKDAVLVADDAVGVEKKAQRDGTAVEIPTDPAEYAVLFAELARAAPGFHAAVGALGLHQRRERLRAGDQRTAVAAARVLFALRVGHFDERGRCPRDRLARGSNDGLLLGRSLPNE